MRCPHLLRTYLTEPPQARSPVAPVRSSLTADLVDRSKARWSAPVISASKGPHATEDATPSYPHGCDGCWLLGSYTVSSCVCQTSLLTPTPNRRGVQQVRNVGVIVGASISLLCGWPSSSRLGYMAHFTSRRRAHFLILRALGSVGTRLLQLHQLSLLRRRLLIINYRPGALLVVFDADDDFHSSM